MRRSKELNLTKLEDIYRRFTSDSLKEFGKPTNLCPSFSDFKKWYKSKNGHAFKPQIIDSEESAPDTEGTYFTNRLSLAVARVRDRFIVQKIAERLDKDQIVLNVFGASHLATQTRSLEKMLGKPVLVEQLGQ